MSKQPPSAEPRQHYAVWLTLKEAQYLNRRASNVGSKPCCSHLDEFHNEGRTTYGGEWRSCNLCDCITETPHVRWPCWSCNHDPREAVDWRRRTNRLIASLVIIAPAAALLGWWLS